jgi:predicted unusual protein kinase regulating ubiquinone biosynthesis (AarF/ABC1/UbiB family)
MHLPLLSGSFQIDSKSKHAAKESKASNEISCRTLPAGFCGASPPWIPQRRYPPDRGGDHLSDDRRPKKKTRVPTGRVERLARMGWMAGEFAVGGFTESAKRLAGSLPADPSSAFLSAKRATKLASRLAEMRGAAMKLGQLLSLEGDDLLPPEFVEALAVLRSTADTMPVTQLRRALGRSYGKGWEARFSEFDFEPLAAASIGQVHAARTTAGDELALKIQYPGVARSIDSDVNNLASVLKMTRILPVDLDIREIIAEAKHQLKQEADYESEARHLVRYRKLMHDEPDIRVPRHHPDFSTRRVLAMDRMHGRPIEDLRSPEYSQSLRDEIGTTLQRLMFRELFEFRFMQTDPNFANYLFDPEAGALVLLDFGSAREFQAEFVENFRRIVRAMIAEDLDGIREAAIAIGYLSGQEPPARQDAVASLIAVVGEPLRHGGVYDYNDSQLAARARDGVFDLVWREGFNRAPPPETIFLHRKLGGIFMLCARIKARVDTAALIEPFLFEER